MNEPKRRRARFTREEMQRIIDDRDKHKHMTTLEWAQQFPISTSLYYKFKERLGTKPKKKMGRPPGKKDAKPRKPRQPPKPTGNLESQLKEALAAIKHWRARATEIAEALIIESLQG